MAIGDTINAGLMRTDFSALQQTGHAQANAAFGNAVGNFIEGHYKKKKEKEDRLERKNFYLAQGFDEDEATAASGDKELGKFLERKRVEDRNFKLAEDTEKRFLDSAKSTQGRLEAADQLVADKTLALEKFGGDLLSEAMDPEVARQVEEVRPGMFALGNEGQRNRFLDYQQEQQPKVAVGELGSADFAKVARGEGFDPTLAAGRFVNLQKAEAELAKSEFDDYGKEIALTKEIESVRQLMQKPLADIATDFNKNQQVKDFKNVKISFDTIRAAAEVPSAAGDLSLIFAYMKVLDPNSSVREGEFANAQNAAGVPERIRNMFNNWSEGHRLSKEQRNDFIGQARKLAEAREKSIEPVVRQTRQKFDRQIVGQRRGLSPKAADKLFEEIVFPNIMLGTPPGASPPGASPAQTPSTLQPVTLPTSKATFTPIPQ
jgi:hypothetical protein